MASYTARSFQDIQATMTHNTMVTRFQNMLSKVDNMIQSNNIYSVWIRLVIGKSENNKIVFDTTSTNPDENLVISLDYDKCGAGQSNEFTFKVAFDLFNYGQETKKNVEALDELIYKALDISSYDDATDSFYCKFQYGYNIVGDTQIVSPLYEGLITNIVPSIDYTNGKTYYTITGNSFITGSSLTYTFEAFENRNGLEVVAETLWYYCGNQDTLSNLSTFSNIKANEQHEDVINNKCVTLFNIDVPSELVKNASTIEKLEVSNEMTVIDYIKLVLSNTYNTADTRYNSETGTYNVVEGQFKPYYTYYITDSGGSGVPTIHITYISSTSDVSSINGIDTIDFTFEWFKRSNNIVVGWNPQVDLKTYFLTRAQIEKIKGEELEVQRQIEENETKIEEGTKEIREILQGPTLNGKPLYGKVIAKLPTAEAAVAAIANAGLKAKLAKIQSELDSFAQGYEYYKATITLVGIPSDIPLNIILNIVPNILESPSRTKGKYYVLGSTDKISTNGLFTTTINLFRLKD